MPDTVISRFNETAYNELNQFIFTDHRNCPIVDGEITGMYKDAYDSNKNQSPQDPSY